MTQGKDQNKGTSAGKVTALFALSTRKTKLFAQISRT